MIKTWNWGTIDFIILYSIVSIAFVSSIVINTWKDYKNPIKPTNLVLATNALTILGFLTLCIYQYRKKWIFGIGVCSVLVIISILSLLFLLYSYKKKD